MTVMPNVWCISFLWLAAGGWNANDMLLVVSVFILRVQWMKADDLFLLELVLRMGNFSYVRPPSWAPTY